VVVLAGSNFPTIWAESLVATDTLKRIGLNIDVQALDWGTVVQRRESKEPIDKGGWSIIFTFFSGTGNVTPATNTPIRGNGREAGRYGWASDDKIEALRNEWFDAPDLAGQKKIAAELQARFFEFVPYVPLGMYYAPTAYQNYLQDVRDGFPQPYGVRRV
jgi:peptide/nickel transport system substrate-binding protein